MTPVDDEEPEIPKPQLTDDAIEERELRQALGEERVDLADKIQFGMLMEQWIERDPCGKYLVARAQDQIDRATQIFLNAQDLSDRDVKEAHFAAHVAATIILWMQEAIGDGRDATKAVAASEQMDMEQEP